MSSCGSSGSSGSLGKNCVADTGHSTGAAPIVIGAVPALGRDRVSSKQPAFAETGKRDRIEKYQDALRAIPKPGTGCHGALLSVANLGIRAGVSPEQIAYDLAHHIPRGTRTVPAKEISEAVQKAVNDAGMATGGGRVYAPVPPPKPALDGPAYLRKLITRSDGATEADLWELSPFRIDWAPGPQDAVTVLRMLYRSDEILFCGGKYDTAVQSVRRWVAAIQAGAVPEHIAPNPMTGRAHPTKDGKESFRSDSAVADHRFVVVEFDAITEAHQMAFWHSIIQGKLLPVAALIHSGGKSVHGWIKVDLPDAAAWDEVVRVELYGASGRLTALGADKACANPARLSRLAGHKRDGSRLQRLLYLNPSTGVPQ